LGQQVCLQLFLWIIWSPQAVALEVYTTAVAVVAVVAVGLIH
jgi:hypothetical protein